MSLIRLPCQKLVNRSSCVVTFGKLDRCWLNLECLEPQKYAFHWAGGQVEYLGLHIASSEIIFHIASNNSLLYWFEL